MDSFCKHDFRISFLETDAAANDFAVTPRLEGVNHLIGEKPVPDYAVFWDDETPMPLMHSDELRMRWKRPVSLTLCWSASDMALIPYLLPTSRSDR